MACIPGRSGNCTRDRFYPPWDKVPLKVPDVSSSLKCSLLEVINLNPDWLLYRQDNGHWGRFSQEPRKNIDHFKVYATMQLP